MNNELVYQLKEEHKEILNRLDRVNVVGLLTNEGKILLLDLKELLVRHLKREDKDLYPLLYKASVVDEELFKITQQFAGEMTEITAFAVNFFEKSVYNKNRFKLAKEYSMLYSALHVRINREEVILYDLYEQAAGYSK